MTNASGPDAARPETNPSAETAGQSTAGPQPPATAAAPDAPIEGAAAGPIPAGAPEPPETKEKNKIFESVRLKARLMMADQELEKLRAEVEQLRAAPAEYQDKNMRLLAEMENLRRRTERERADTAKFAITRFARDVLTVADNFQRAIDTAPPEASVEEGPLKSFHDGVILTGRELLNVLERNGVKKIDPTGERFDPNLHQAMMQVDNTEVPSGTVMQTFQPAYMIEDRILRPAMVVVSRGGPKVAKAETAEGQETVPGAEAAADANGASDAANGAGQTAAADDVPPKPATGDGAA
jgi:molecular chaperone GrpE